MSAIEMAPLGNFSYQRLRPETDLHDERGNKRSGILRPRKWHSFRRIRIRRRFRLKVPSLRRLWRKRARLVSAMRNSYGKVKRRFKEGQNQFGDLFAGNYLFMQINPSSLKYLEKGHNLDGFPSRFSLSKID